RWGRTSAIFIPDFARILERFSRQSPSSGIRMISCLTASFSRRLFRSDSKSATFLSRPLLRRSVEHQLPPQPQVRLGAAGGPGPLLAAPVENLAFAAVSAARGEIQRAVNINRLRFERISRIGKARLRLFAKSH